ncbi:hypothetical protein L6164_014348 [Bauhinia variegata]|uniref:Uncharacterized protein n=1 Tax=Bauhinia variegata TaxID=167791 RepID=A0ACB9NJ18_BAUVA|nr:hypothetical protein L6164_014348 [Bauhinia variegata]
MSQGVKIIAHLLFSWLVFSNIMSSVNAEYFNVIHYGALGDGTSDDSLAFLEAWEAACSTRTENSTVIIPENKTFLVYPVSFSGPCKAKNITFLILGKIVGPISPLAWEGINPSLWLTFNGINGLNISGSGIIDGRGSGWWNQSCRDHPGLAVNILSCNASNVRGVHVMNSPQTHILVMDSNRVDIRQVTIRAPGSSPNTDGIHIHSSRNVNISQIDIGTGDDCVSVGDSTSNINISDVKCGPGHGISIGSLGRGGNFVKVENIHVSNAYFNRTTNGARIKTWQVGKGYVRNVTFENLYFNSVENPVIIDQYYCNVRGTCKEQQSGVHITNVTFSNLFGTSLSSVAVSLHCSHYVACTGIFFNSVQLTSAKAGSEVTSSCSNAQGFAFRMVQPEHCLKI